MISRNFVEKIVQEQSCELLAIVPVQKEEDYIKFKDWLDSGFHAEMNFLEKNKFIRENPGLVLEGSKSIIVFGLSYF